MELQGVQFHCIFNFGDCFKDIIKDDYRTLIYLCLLEQVKAEVCSIDYAISRTYIYFNVQYGIAALNWSLQMETGKSRIENPYYISFFWTYSRNPFHVVH